MICSFIHIFILILSVIHAGDGLEIPDDFIQSARDAFGSFFSNFSSLTKIVKETVSAAVEEKCVYKCPNGETPTPNPYFEPIANGCGVPGLKLHMNLPKYIPTSQLEACCNEHDVCYGICNKSKDKCDAKFSECLYKICSSLKKYVSDDILKGCKGVAKTFYTAVTAMGCKYYLEAQKEACICHVNYYDFNTEL